jgi:protein-S-isoprenylcysteine O-methyltransferase Ste14
MFFSLANPIGMAIVVAGWVITQTALSIRYSTLPKAGASQPQNRDLLSILFFVVQSASVFAAFWGVIRFEDDAFGPTGQIEIAIVVALVLAGLGFFVSALVTLGRNFAAVAQVQSDGNLVTSGPYAIVRNPIYLGYFLLLLATPLAFGHLRNLWLAVPLYLLGAVPRILVEERVLRAHFGAAYDAYAARVKRLIPLVW